jgi:hypothetical protein
MQAYVFLPDGLIPDKFVILFLGAAITAQFQIGENFTIKWGRSTMKEH